jgi:hypothetical protein
VRSLVLALLVLPDLATALDLRGVEPGDSCYKAEQVEAQLGSTPKYEIASMRRDGILGFEDASSAPGAPIEILYNCSDQPGVVSHYSIAVTVRDEASALRALDAARDKVIAQVGQPSFDSDALPSRQKEEYKRLSERVWIVRGLEWKTVRNQSIAILLTHRNDLWRISTVVQAKREAPDSLNRQLP